MSDITRQTRSYLMQLFAEHGFHPRSDLGQNFLIDLNILEFVVSAADLSHQDVVLEVGTGTGGLTTFLAGQAAAVVSVEYDRNMHRLASRAVAPFRNVTLLNCDALENKNHLAPEVLAAVQAALAVDPDRELKLVANLPYNVATPVISNLVATELPWSRMVVTIQHELAERMQARPRTSPYGALAVWLQSQCAVQILRKLGPTVFWPRPKVNSAVVEIRPVASLRAALADRAFFHDYIRRVFGQRRKLLRGVLAGMYGDQWPKPAVEILLRELSVPENARAEELDVPDHVALANRLLQARAGLPHVPGENQSVTRPGKNDPRDWSETTAS